MKVCAHCKVTKTLEEFIKDKRRSDGRGSICRPCRRKESKKDYEKHHDSRRAYGAAYSEKVTQEKREIIIQWFRDNPCVTCGETDLRVLQCDHIEPADKSYSVAALVSKPYGVQTLIEELNKCRSLCANCHMRWTADQFGFWRSKETALSIFG